MTWVLSVSPVYDQMSECHLRVGISAMELIGDVTFREECSRFGVEDRAFADSTVRAANEHERGCCRGDRLNVVSIDYD